MSNQCILAIGKTGNGKSFTGTVFGAPTKVGHSTTSETDDVTVNDCGNGRFYVDTPGFDDSDENKGDTETTRVILRTMVDENIKKLITILWFVVPDNRATASLHRQARFIESLAQYYEGNVWDNVIIVHKGDKIEQGPYDAAKQIAQNFYEGKHKKPPGNDKDLLKNTSHFKILLFESLPADDLRREGNFTSDRLNESGIYKKSEPERILAVYASLMKEHLEHPIPLTFQKFKCKKCPEDTDPRLADAKCHLEGEFIHSEKEKMIHRGVVTLKHPKGTYWRHIEAKENYHTEPATRFHTTSRLHPGRLCGGEEYESKDRSLGANLLRIATLNIVDPYDVKSKPYYYSCCGGERGSSGCSYKCCDRNPGCTSVFTCCQSDNSGCINGHKCCNKPARSTGCRERYKCCQSLEQCTKFYECCDSKNGSKGCKEFYTCCNKLVEEAPQGCYPVCEDCSNDLNSTGCKKVCKNCKEIQSEIIGCVTTSHDFGPDAPQNYSWILNENRV
ncbi:hypothetical protein Glove_321g39 [Diversispora epigaea]|uniref:AIG1-type G domain-containing protein n=1 Tax=Diversispora epigaea TaxID=1348612 RepID=A0A397HU19_9GLOM|nr:hypothetical protein Glove_321g39 [Diversispora epigaea]